MSITHLTSTSQLSTLLGSKKGLVVIDFHATWCGPCHAIAPYYESLAKSNPAVTFCKCDVDQARDVAQQYRVSAMPTFVFLKNGQKVDQVRGADKASIAAALAKHSGGGAGAGTTHSWGSGNRLGDGSDPSPSSSSTPSAGLNLGSVKMPGSVGEARGMWDALSPNAKVGIALLAAYLVLLYFVR